MLQGQHALLEFLSQDDIWEIKTSLTKVFEAASFESKLSETNEGRAALQYQWEIIKRIENIETQFKIIEDREK